MATSKSKKTKRSAGNRKVTAKKNRTASTSKKGGTKKIGRPKKEKVPTHPVLHKDHRYLSVNGELVPKSKVALKVIETFLEKHPRTSIEKLREEFPNELHPAGLIVPMQEAQKKSKKRARFYLDQPLTIGGRKFAVCKEFGHNNMTGLIQAAEKQRVRIKRVSNTEAMAMKARSRKTVEA
jgi:hypothetical protein